MIFSFLQIVGANANFEKSRFQHIIPVATAAQEDVKTMRVTIIGIPNDSVGKERVYNQIV
ncbi:hypothetical protein [Bartonella sp. B39]